MDARITRTRTAVLDAARAVLLADGLAAVTPTRVAEVSGVARRTIYRHWPSPDDLLHDALAGASFPTYERTGDLATDLHAHLEQLRAALTHGPLAYILHALGERAAIEPTLASLRARLVDSGCAPLRDLLAEHGASVPLIDELVLDLEGPVFSAVLVHGVPVTDEHLVRLVATTTERVGASRGSATAQPPSSASSAS